MNLDKANDLAHDWLYAAEGYIKAYNEHKDFLELLTSIIDYGPLHLSLITLFNIYRNNELAPYNACSARSTSHNNVKILGNFLGELQYDIEDDGELYLIEFTSAFGPQYKITSDNPLEYKPLIINNLRKLGYVNSKITGYTAINEIRSSSNEKISMYKILSFLRDRKDFKPLIENKL